MFISTVCFNREYGKNEQTASIFEEKPLFPTSRSCLSMVEVYSYMQSHREMERAHPSTVLWCWTVLKLGGRLGGQAEEKGLLGKFFFIYILFFWITFSLGQTERRLSAGSYEWTAPGWCEPGCCTHCSFCTRLGVCLSPGCIGNHGNQGTDRPPSCRRKAGKKNKKTGGVKLAQIEGCKQELKLITISHSAKRIRKCWFSKDSVGRVEGVLTLLSWLWLKAPPCCTSPWPVVRGSHRTARTYGPGSPRTRTGSPCCHCGSKGGGWGWVGVVVVEGWQKELRAGQPKRGEQRRGITQDSRHTWWAWRRASARFCSCCFHSRPRSEGSLPSPG